MEYCQLKERICFLCKIAKKPDEFPHIRMFGGRRRGALFTPRRCYCEDCMEKHDLYLSDNWRGVLENNQNKIDHKQQQDDITKGVMDVDEKILEKAQNEKKIYDLQTPWERLFVARHVINEKHSARCKCHYCVDYRRCYAGEDVNAL